MMRIILMLILMIPMVALGQGSVRRFSTIAKMVQANPMASAVGGKLTAEVVGYSAEGDTGGPSRIVDWIADSALATNRANVFDSPFGGQWVFRDNDSSTQDVRWWGAVGGDGSTDDTDAIQDAVNYVKTNELTLYFPPGRFRISQSLNGTTSGTGFTIEGSGRDNTEIIGNDPGYPLLDFTGANKVTIRDLTVWGNVPGTNVSLCGIMWGRPASNASSGEHVMERVKVWGNFQKWGVIANSAELCIYRECEFYTGYNLAPPDNAMTAFCLSGGSGTRGLTSRYNTPGNGSGGNSCQSFYDCKFFNYTPTTVAGYFTTYNLELDGVMSCVMVNPYYYSRYNGTQVRLNNLSTSAFDTLDIIGARHEYLTPLSGGTEPASYAAAASKKFKSIRIQGGTLTYFFGEGGSWITGLKVNDVMWKTIAAVPVVDVWILIDSDLYANKGGDGSFAQTQTPTYSIRGWSHNVNLDYQRTQNYGMHSAPDLGFGRRGLKWDGATDYSALLYDISTNRIGTNDFTIYVRVRLPDSMPGNHAGIATLTMNTNGISQASSWTARLKTDGRIETFLFDASGSQYNSRYVPSDFWTQKKGQICDLVFVRTTNDCKVYINGFYNKGDEDQNTASPPGWGANVSASVFALGISGSASQYWRSEIYRAALFDRALTDTEILALSHSTFNLDADAIIPNMTQGFGPSIADLGSSNLVGRLVGGVSHLVHQQSGIEGIPEVTEPSTNHQSTATVWLEEADTFKSLKVKWPDGQSTSLWPNTNATFLGSQPPSYYLDRGNHSGSQSYTTITGLGDLAIEDYPPFDGDTYGINNGVWTVATSGSSYTFSDGVTNSGGTVSINIEPGSNITFATNATKITISAVTSSSTNGTPVSVDGGAVLTAANLADTSEINHTASGTNVTSALIDGSISTNRINPTFHGWISGKQDALTFSTGVTNAGGTIRAEIAPGANITFATNAQTITISATAPASTNSWQIGVDGAVVTAPNLNDSSELGVMATGTNVTYSLNSGSISTNKISTSFHQWISSLGGSDISVDGLGMAAANLSDSSEIAVSATGTNVTASVVSGSLSTNRANAAFHQWVNDKVLYVHGTEVTDPNLVDTGTVEVTATGSNIELDVPDGSITYAKLQNVSATNRVIGLGSTSPGDAVELAVGDGLITSSTDLKINIEAGSGIELATNGSKRVTITSKGYAPANDAVANLLLVTTSETTDNNQDTTWRDVTPSARSGMSATIPGGTLLSGSVMKVELSGVMDAAAADWAPRLRMVFDGPTASDYTITFIMNEPGSTFPSETTTWKAEAFIVVASAGSPATVRQRSFSLWADGAMTGSGSLAGYGLMTSGQSSNSLDTAVDNIFKLEYQGVNANMQSFSVTSVVIWML